MGKIHSKNYVTIQGWMVTDLGLKGNELLVYAIIYGFTQEKNQWFVGSRQYLADWTGATKQTVGNYLKSMVERGLIEKREKYVNGVKFCDYRVNNSSRVGEKITQGVGEKTIPINNNNTKNNTSKKNIESCFETVWKAYPNKVGKIKVSDLDKKKIFEYGVEQMLRAVERYKEGLAKEKWRSPQNGNTFFHSGYVDYLDENYETQDNDNNQTPTGIMTYRQMVESGERQ